MLSRAGGHQPPVGEPLVPGAEAGEPLDLRRVQSGFGGRGRIDPERHGQRFEVQVPRRVRAQPRGVGTVVLVITRRQCLERPCGVAARGRGQGTGERDRQLEPYIVQQFAIGAQQPVPLALRHARLGPRTGRTQELVEQMPGQLDEGLVAIRGAADPPDPVEVGPGRLRVGRQLRAEDAGQRGQCAQRVVQRFAAHHGLDERLERGSWTEQHQFDARGGRLLVAHAQRGEHQPGESRRGARRVVEQPAMQTAACGGSVGCDRRGTDPAERDRAAAQPGAVRRTLADRSRVDPSVGRRAVQPHAAFDASRRQGTYRGGCTTGPAVQPPGLGRGAAPGERIAPAPDTGRMVRFDGRQEGCSEHDGSSEGVWTDPKSDAPPSRSDRTGGRRIPPGGLRFRSIR